MTRLPAGGLAVSTADLAEAMKGFAPAASWGVTNAAANNDAGPRGWEDVGGMPDVVDALREALALPTRFARLCARCVAADAGSTAAVNTLAIDIVLKYARLISAMKRATRVHKGAVHLYLSSSTHTRYMPACLPGIHKVINKGQLESVWLSVSKALQELLRTMILQGATAPAHGRAAVWSAGLWQDACSGSRAGGYRHALRQRQGA